MKQLVRENRGAGCEGTREREREIREGGEKLMKSMGEMSANPLQLTLQERCVFVIVGVLLDECQTGESSATSQ